MIWPIAQKKTVWNWTWNFNTKKLLILVIALYGFFLSLRLEISLLVKDYAQMIQNNILNQSLEGQEVMWMW